MQNACSLQPISGLDEVRVPLFRNRGGTKMRSARLLVASAIASMLATCTFAGSAQAATTVVGPGDLIQAAIDAAQPGDTGSAIEE